MNTPGLRRRVFFRALNHLARPHYCKSMKTGARYVGRPSENREELC
jgi:hypothetical protein